MLDETLEEWIAKAEQDYQYALLGIRQRKNSLYDGICFHSQQCVEKYLKCFLVRNKIQFKRVHDLDELYNLAAPIDESFKLIFHSLMILNPYSVIIRYPGVSSTKEEAHNAIAAMKQVRSFIRARLGLKSK